MLLLRDFLLFFFGDNPSVGLPKDKSTCRPSAMFSLLESVAIVVARYGALCCGVELGCRSTSEAERLLLIAPITRSKQCRRQGPESAFLSAELLSHSNLPRSRGKRGAQTPLSQFWPFSLSLRLSPPNHRLPRHHHKALPPPSRRFFSSQQPWRPSLPSRASVLSRSNPTSSLTTRAPPARAGALAKAADDGSRTLVLDSGPQRQPLRDSTLVRRHSHDLSKGIATRKMCEIRMKAAQIWVAENVESTAWHFS